MGGKSSSSQANQTTNVTTSTTTNIRDIGLTGAAAVDMANILETGVLERSIVNAGVFETVVQEAGSTLKQLVGGATDFANQLVKTGAATGAGYTQEGREQALQLISTGESIKESELMKALPWLIIGAVTIVSIPILKK